MTKYVINNFNLSKKVIKNSRIFIVLLLGAILFLSANIITQAATFTVTKTADTNDGTCDSDCSLREAVATANAETTDDVIEFDPTVFAMVQTIKLSSQLIIENKGSLVINGRGANSLIISGNNTNRIFLVNTSASLTLNGLQIVDGNGTGFGGVSGRGGGIYNDGILRITKSIISNSTAENFGGGIYNLRGTVTIEDSSISSNKGGPGGGIFNSSGTLTISNSTVNGNTANGNGGGINNQSAGTLNLINSTVSNNSAPGPTNGVGGGITSFGEANLINVTVSSNKATFWGGAFNGGDKAFNSRNSIIASNTSTSNNSPDFSGTLTSQGYNLIENTIGATIIGDTTGNILGVDPQLLPLGNYGGTTQTVALMPTSPAIDSADPNNFPETDQRGIPRPQDGNAEGSSLTDIGAFELKPIVVTNTNDSGEGALRQAIIDANTNAGTDTVVFKIGSGVQTIRPVTLLPHITDPVIIDGATQPGFSGTPIIVLDGSSVPDVNDEYGFWITAGRSILRSIVITNIRDGQAVRLDTNGGNTIQGCYFGVDPDGSTRRTNHAGIIIDSSDNLIGGTNAAERNVISGSSFDNIGIVGASSNNRIQGNYIGTNAAGTASLNGGGYGIEIFTTGSGNIVGGTEPGAGNLISGNGQAGIFAGARDTVIQGNLIGTDFTGTMRVPNLTSGVSISTLNILVGGTTPAARNIISGNNFTGVTVSIGDSKTRSRVQGNYIGVDITGRKILSNTSSGIVANSSTIIGGTEPGAGNVIAGNGGGITLSGSDNPGSFVQGNLIGTDATGTVALGNGGGRGLDIRSSFNTIGGTTPAVRNVISGNNTAIDIGSSTTAQLSGNIIQGNYIGTDITGMNALPNSGQAISVTGSNNVIGGANEGTGNIIVYNNGVGVRISGSFNPSTGNVIRRNSLFMNAGLAIDLGASGVTQNDGCDGDTGANNLQNYPVLASAFSNGTNTNITGSLNSTASATFTIDFYASPSYDGTNFGEGKIYIGSTNVTTASNCNADFNVTLPFPSAGSQFITATATDSSGNTSEFSRFVLATGTSNKAKFDFDGDGRSDISVFRPSTGSWYLLQSSNNSFFGQSFGISTDTVTPADYDGDGKTDFAVFRPENGTWYLQQSTAGFTAVQFGQSGDIPVPADYDGDGEDDIAVYRPSTGGWYRLNSSNGQFVAVNFGIAEDKPTIGDFDGDGKADIAVFRPSTGSWYRLNSSNNQFVAVQFGVAEDKPTPADFDGDGKTDVAVYRPSTGSWYRLNSSNEQFVAVSFGISEDRPVPADYDGDGKADIAVFRPSNGNWYLLRSTAGFTSVQFGVSEDKPVPNAFVPQL